MNFLPPEIVLNILSFIDCLKLGDAQLVCHQFRSLIPLIHKSHRCLFSKWVQTSKLIESKFKKSNKFFNFLGATFLPQYGITLRVSFLDYPRFAYVIEISDYLDQRFFLKYIPAHTKLHLHESFDPFHNKYVFNFHMKDRSIIRTRFVVDLVNFDVKFNLHHLLWFNEIDHYSEYFKSLHCELVSSRIIKFQSIKVGYLELFLRRELISSRTHISPEGKFHIHGLGTPKSGTLHIYHFINHNDLWLIVVKEINTPISTIALLKLNENDGNLIKLKEFNYHTNMICPIYCPYSKTIFILENFKNRLLKFYQF